MTDEYICKVCGHRAGDHAVNNRCLNCDCVADPYLEQLVALRAEIDEMNKMIASSPLEDALIKECDALRAQHIAEMNAKVEALEWRDKEICALRAELEEVKTMMDYTFRQNIEFQLQLDILKQAILDHKDDLIFPKEWCDDALAEIEKEGKGAS